MKHWVALEVLDRITCLTAKLCAKWIEQDRSVEEIKDLLIPIVFKRLKAEVIEWITQRVDHFLTHQTLLSWVDEAVNGFTTEVSFCDVVLSNAVIEDDTAVS